MADCESLLAGEVVTELGVNRLSARLAAAGLRVEVSDSSHFTGGRYIRIREGIDGVHFTLEHINGSYLADADADSVEEMHAAALRVSRALTGLGIRHRFDVHDRTARLRHRLHHLWPDAAD